MRRRVPTCLLGASTFIVHYDMVISALLCVTSYMWHEINHIIMQAFLLVLSSDEVVLLVRHESFFRAVVPCLCCTRTFINSNICNVMT
jgi:hypothetical protein